MEIKQVFNSTSRFVSFLAVKVLNAVSTIAPPLLPTSYKGVSLHGLHGDSVYVSL